jgi:hypothetical protein
MKSMRILSSLILAMTMTGCSFAQLAMPSSSKEWKATLKIVDESGQPIIGADVQVSYILPAPPGTKSWGTYGNYGDKIEGLTDTNGIFSASHTDSSVGLGIIVEKAGYYTTRVGHQLYLPDQFDAQTVNANHNPTMTLVLKKIGKPIAMYAKREEMKLQQEDKPMGFNLMVGDWVTPNGKGEHTDMFFTVHRKIISKSKYACTLTITFPNKGDGIVVAPSEPDTGSEFKTSRTAVESGYESELDLHYSNTNSPESVFGYFVRVQTVLDENGNVKSALYGKIRGNFRFYAGTIMPRAGMGFDYYLNPTPNDRNVEFDPKQNLMKWLGGLRSTELRVTAP